MMKNLFGRGVRGVVLVAALGACGAGPSGEDFSDSEASPNAAEGDDIGAESAASEDEELGVSREALTICFATQQQCFAARDAEFEASGVLCICQPPGSIFRACGPDLATMEC